ncbi:uncharacterized protein KY384_000663 [Bacidia gigantensis]|uniref:uncharacterized protein n=1 Tax=Bacidia gigantensis TaxID=2732470 RepID=UPI001D041946|nr:uncharacterized protein KY384_000663 [Bacidia gigantensis]KAG8525901.1 hypothetical protein KY384_000663 [Bacidia gigantensis]
MRFSLGCLATVQILLLSRVATAVYRDEAYQIDFHHALLGIPQAHTTFFHKPSNNSKASLLFSLSENGIVGAVNPKDGTVLWRQRLGEEEKTYVGEGLLRPGEGSNTVISAFDGKVQVLDAVNGRLGWTWQANGRVKAVSTTENAGQSLVFAAVQEESSLGVVRCFSAEAGEEKWQHRDSEGDSPHALLTAQGRLFYISLHAARLKGLKIKATELDILTGHQNGNTISLSSDGEVPSEDSLLFSGLIGGLPIIMWSDKSFKTVKVASVHKSQSTTLGALSNNGKPTERIFVHAAPDPDGEPHFLLHFQAAESHWAKVYHIDATTGTASLAYDLPEIPDQGAFSASIQGPKTYFVRYTSSEISLVFSDSSVELQKWPVPPKHRADTTELRSISHAAAEVASRGANKFSLRSVVALKSGDWELIRNSESLWIRKEGLSGVVAATITEVPRDENFAQELLVEGQYNFFWAYIHRLRRHLGELQDLPYWLEQQYNTLTALAFGSDPGSSGSSRLRKDKFGFNKIIIVATRYGRLAALDTGSNGKVIWQMQAALLQSSATWDILGLEAEDGTVTVRAAKGEILQVESSTGKVLKSQHAALIRGLETTIAIPDAKERSALIGVNDDGTICEIPDVDFGGGVNIVTEDQWLEHIPKKKVSLSWVFRPATSERIVQLLHRPSHDPVASIGRALGDRNVLYKYLNPHVILVTAVNVQTSTATFYLLESTSGSILHTTTHSNVDTTKPIASTLSENILTYSLYSHTSSQDTLQTEKKVLQGYQLVVSELYESPFPNDRGPLASSSNTSSQGPLDLNEERTANLPHAISQTYLISDSVSYLATTSTLQGITPRSLLCINSDLKTITSIPGHILDPRRPVGRDSTSAEAEEGLYRYNAVLDFDPKWILNHKREMLGLSKVIASPTLLESTSLVFAFGDVDLFGTRVRKKQIDGQWRT